VKARLDELLVARGLVPTRSRAQALIRAGEVRVGGQVFDKPGMSVAADAQIEVRQAQPYVSRGGLKLAGALAAFGIDPADAVCLDVGASTGGFTDVLLQQGARQVYAVDVGRGQLAWALRQDPRVVNLERTDVRRLGPLPRTPSLAVVDVSFISLGHVLGPLRALLAPDGQAVALVKPQFEAGRHQVGRGGLVRDPLVHRSVLLDVLGKAAAAGWRLVGAAPAAVRGGSGNQEYFVHLAAPGSSLPDRPPAELATAALASVAAPP
jgi:23S rRNA (cytidine1920-2'-O)/16S rRNA (cytidine1409-2'-O)-methyltransferase